MVSATIANNPKYEWKKVAEVHVDKNGEFRMALVPGEQYLIGVYDPEVLKMDATTLQLVKVQADEFTEVTIEYPKVLVPPAS